MQSTRESQIIGVSEGAATRANSADADVRPGSITSSIINGADVHADRSTGETGHSQAVLAVLGLLAALPVSAALANNHESNSGSSDAFSASLLGENDPVLRKIDAGFQTKKITRKHITYGPSTLAQSSADYRGAQIKTEVSPVRQLTLDDGQGNKVTVYLTEVSKVDTNLFFEPTKFDVVMLEGKNEKGEKVLNTHEYFMFVRVTEKGQLVLTYRLASAQANASPTASTFMEVALNISIDLKPGDSNIVISRKIQDALQKSNKIDVTKKRIQILNGGAQAIILNNLDGTILTHPLRSDEEIRVLMNDMGSNARLLNLLQSGDATANVTQQSLTPTAPKAPTPQPTKVEPTVPSPTATKEIPISIKGFEGVPTPKNIEILNGVESGSGILTSKYTGEKFVIGFGKEIAMGSKKYYNPIIIAVFNDSSKEWVFKEAGGGDLARQLGMLYGFAIHNRDFKLVDVRYKNLIQREASQIAFEEAFEARYTWPLKDSTSTQKIDAILNSKISEGKLLKGHILIESSPTRLPNWLLTEAKIAETKLLNDKNNTQLREEIRTQFISYLEYHIKSLMTKYKGAISEYVLVNEALDSNGLMNKDNFWNTLIGSDYIEIAIKAARSADPGAKLIINDFGVEFNNPKSRALLQLVKGLKEKGLLTDNDGVGLQSHISVLNPDLTKEAIKINLRQYALAKARVSFTELDMFDVLKDSQFSRQAEVYRLFIEAALEINTEYGWNVVDGVMFWGINDSDSYMKSTRGKGDLPLLYKDDLSPKEAVFSIKDLFVRALLAQK